MNSKKDNYKYIEWMDAESMHQSTMDWLNNLRFIKDEQTFFEDLIDHYVWHLVDSKNYPKSKKIVDKLAQLKTNNTVLIEALKLHRNELEVLVDGVDELDKEEQFKQSHREFEAIYSEFMEENTQLKHRLFTLVKSFMKEDKKNRLLEEKNESD